MSPPSPWSSSGLKPGIHGLFLGDANRGAPRQPGTAARDVWLVVAGSQHLGRRPPGGGGGPQPGGAAQLHAPGPGPAAARGESRDRGEGGGEALAVGVDGAVCCGAIGMTLCGRWWLCVRSLSCEMVELICGSLNGMEISFCADTFKLPIPDYSAS